MAGEAIGGVSAHSLRGSRRVTDSGGLLIERPVFFQGEHDDSGRARPLLAIQSLAHEPL